MADGAWLTENAEKVGIIGHLAFDVVAFLRGWIVTGDVYNRDVTSLREERDILRKSLDDANARDRAKLERIEAGLENFVAPRR